MEYETYSRVTVLFRFGCFLSQKSSLWLVIILMVIIYFLYGLCYTYSCIVKYLSL